MRIGIDLGGTKVEGVLMDPHGEVVHTERRATPRSDYEATVGAIAQLAFDLDALAGHRCAIGVGTPGAWLEKKRRMKNCNSTWLNGKPLLDDLENALQRPVKIANDANCFALSEALAGAGEGAKCVFGVILGTGVGGGWVVDSALLSGPNAIAGEWGHTPLPYFRADPATTSTESKFQERRCYCGRANCIEAFLSGPGLGQTHRELTGRSIDARAIRGDPDAFATIELYTVMLARALAQIINVMDPDVIVLGGGVSNLVEIYDRVPSVIDRYAFTSEGRTRIVPARYGDSSGVRGAAWLNPP